jgi:release factor glutamine methyltransferase
MKIKDILNNARIKLKEFDVENSGNIARILLANELKTSKEYLTIHDLLELEDCVKEKYFNNIDKLCSGYPLQYITNNQEFMGMKFYVDENVLIPQPDTEVLVEETIKICDIIKKKPLKILDLCTGSGAIAISIAKKCKNAFITATDISEKALKIAERNAKVNNVDIKFIQSDLFEKINDKFNIIVSNPPYIETGIIKTLPKDVQNEPHIALDGGKDGLDFYRKIAEKSSDFLDVNGILLLEIGYNQKNEVERILKNKYKDIYCIKDYAENDRVVIAKKIEFH